MLDPASLAPTNSNPSGFQRVVVAREDDHRAVRGAIGCRNVGDQVGHRDVTNRRVADELVTLDGQPEALQLGFDVAPRLLESVAAHRPRAESHNVASVHHRPFAVEGVGRGRLAALRRACGCAGGIRLARENRRRQRQRENHGRHERREATATVVTVFDRYHSGSPRAQPALVKV